MTTSKSTWPSAFRTKEEAEQFLLSRRDSYRDVLTGCIWARDPSSRAMGKCYIQPCVAFTKAAERVSAFTVDFGA